MSCKAKRRVGLVEQLQKEGCIEAVDQEMYKKREGVIVNRCFLITLAGQEEDKTTRSARETQPPSKKENPIEYHSIEVEQRAELGSGGFGAVYAAKLLKGSKGEERICLKQALEYDDNSDTINDIIREAEHLREIKKHQSSHIIHFRFSCEAKAGSGASKRNQVFIAMDHFDGMDLGYHIRELKNKKERFQDEHLIAIIEKTTRAVKHIQEVLKMLHSDIKPKNVLFNCLKLDLKLIDFGCAITDGEVIRGGTAEYTAPEIIMNSNGEGKDYCLLKSDVYSIGALMYRVITFQKPYYHKKEICDIVEKDATHAHHQVKKVLRKQYKAYRHRLTSDDEACASESLDHVTEESESCISGFQTELQLKLSSCDLITQCHSNDSRKYTQLVDLVSDMLSFCKGERPTVDQIIERVVLIRDEMHKSASLSSMSTQASELSLSSINNSTPDPQAPNSDSKQYRPATHLFNFTTGPSADPSNKNASNRVQQLKKTHANSSGSSVSPQDDNEPLTGRTPFTQADDDDDECNGDLPVTDPELANPHDITDIAGAAGTSNRMVSIPVTPDFKPNKTSTPLRHPASTSVQPTKSHISSSSTAGGPVPSSPTQALPFRRHQPVGHSIHDSTSRSAAEAFPQAQVHDSEEGEARRTVSPEAEGDDDLYDESLPGEIEGSSNRASGGYLENIEIAKLPKFAGEDSRLHAQERSLATPDSGSGDNESVGFYLGDSRRLEKEPQ